MALMLAKLYTALREAGADDDKAREAAEEVASFENRLANVEASLMVLKWMVGSHPHRRHRRHAVQPSPECSRNASPKPWQGHWCDLATTW